MCIRDSSIIISLIRNPGDDFVAGADYHVPTDPEPLLKLIAEIVRGSGGHTILDDTTKKIGVRSTDRLVDPISGFHKLAPLSPLPRI